MQCALSSSSTLESSISSIFMSFPFERMSMHLDTLFELNFMTAGDASSTFLVEGVDPIIYDGRLMGVASLSFVCVLTDNII
jgi:hypothetical protein